MMSRLLDDVATLFTLQADVATASDLVLMSRPLPDVVNINVQSIVHLMSRLLFGVPTSLSTILVLILSRPQSDVVTSCLFLHQFMVA